ncbi:hypothetical protein MPOCJGCO_3213 [Methylobacterium trifolii]|uniref:Uncharacterized protein n=1 Tax=Methylobacterium trifolii TaxID=1003092 RepID=A0ABQ4U2M0_9HYPH|nr:hypothetical protein MPOCJGCO_3213 [Methylobacterium trifolii]
MRVMAPQAPWASPDEPGIHRVCFVAASAGRSTRMAEIEFDA